jgi:predicted RNA-binding Zn ribbon-like protein
VLWPIVRDAAEFLTSHDRELARICAGDPCGFIFLDTSPNRTRRWCVMQDCGNRAKARRHYQRRRASELA